jgi:PHP family Zn ribbon phosphoesterase
MTPGNIVGMAMLAGLEIIAITDHQSCGNCEAAIAISEAMDGPLVIPGMEVESSEEIHLVCLFPDLGSARDMELDIQNAMLPLKNRPEIFGEQLLFNEDDECIGHESRLLLQSCQLSCDEIALKTLGFGGVCIPAHLDREGNSMLTSLGVVPDDFPTAWIEISKRSIPSDFLDEHPDLKRYSYLVSSDSHHLISIEEPGWQIEVAAWEQPSQGRLNLIAALRPRLNG